MQIFKQPWSDTEMFIEGEPVLAFCPLTDQDEANNRIYLTDDSVILVRKGKSQVYPKKTVRNVLLRHRMFLIPIIAGGIMAPLAITAMISQIGYPWLLLLLMLGGFFLFYHGIQGGPAVSVFTNVKDYDTFIPAITPSLRSFVSYLTWQLKSRDDFLYAFLSPEVKKKVISDGVIPRGTQLYLNPAEIPADRRPDVQKILVGDKEIALHFHPELDSEEVMITLDKAVPAELLIEK